jgi:hypothetical protein
MTVMPYEAPERLPATIPDQQALAWVARLRAAAEIAAYIGGTEFVPDSLRNRPEAITAAILFGEEVGLNPMQSLAKVAVIKGRPTLTAEAQRALILAAGHELWFEESTTTRAIAAGRRAGSDRIGRVTWTLDDAKRAGVTGQPNWQRYPAEMLRARSSAALARTMFADVIGGLVAAEELEGEQDANGVVTVETEGAKPKATRRKRAATEPAPASPSTPQGPPAVARQAPASQPPPEDTQPEPHPIEEPKLNQAQSRKMFALFRDTGLEAREDRLAYAMAVIGRQLESSTELTVSEAGRVIDALEQRNQRTNDTTQEQATIDALQELTEKPGDDIPY